MHLLTNARRAALLPWFFGSVLLDPQSIFDTAWKLSPVGAILGLVALVGGLFAWQMFKELKAERKLHRADCTAKDAELARVNSLFQSEMASSRTTLLGVISSLETQSDLISNQDIREELNKCVRELKNGLLAIGEKNGVSAHIMRMD